jgi:cell division protease FtsH
LPMATKNKKTGFLKGDSNNKKGKKKSENLGLLNNVFFYVFLFIMGYLIFGLVFQAGTGVDEKPISEVISLIEEGRVQDVTISENELEIILTDGTMITSQKEATISFDEILANNEIDRNLIVGEIRVEQPVDYGSILTTILLFGIPVLLILYIFRQMRSSSGDILSFGKSRARLFNKDYPKITFENVAGNEEAKTEMKEIVDFLKNPEKYRKLGARIPKGILLVGPSGVGKTLLAKAIAGEANVPFFSVAGSEFMEMLVGVGSARARDLFKMAKTSQPSLIFIDEIDAIGRQRGMGIGGGHDEREQTLNQILIEMDGFDPRTDVIVLAATNRPDMLDPALIRAGRFDRRISIPLPDLKDREEIIKIHMQGKPFEEDVGIERVAKKTVGFSGADIENMMNEAAILAARSGKEKITNIDLEEAALKVTMGSERKTLQSDEERKMTAYHEAGHAVVASNVPDMDPVYRVSIVARGGSLGHTSFPPDRDRYNETKTRLLSMLATMLGGRAAEDVVFNELTIGAADDIDKASKLARKMVTSFGMSNLGPTSYGGREADPWVAREMHAPNYSQEMAAKIDAEVKRLIDEAFTTAKGILSEKREVLDRVAQRLLEKETLEGDEYLQLLSAS